MIKQIQLRGISRTPSDKMSEDGGLSESLNMYIDTAESAPAFIPQDVTSKLGLPADLQAEKVFIHKTANYENYIVVLEGNVFAYTSHGKQTILESIEGEVKNIMSIGNTIVLFTDSKTSYALYRDNAYVLLGAEIPLPQLRLSGVNELGFKQIELDIDELGIYGLYRAFSKDTYNKYLNTGINADEGVQKILTALYEEKTIFARELSSKGYFWGATYIMYGITLFDGSVITTLPEIIGRMSKEERRTDTWQLALSSQYQKVGYNKEFEGGIKATFDVPAYHIKVSADKEYDITGWKDLIHSVDIYVSLPIDTAPDYRRIEILNVTDHDSTNTRSATAQWGVRNEQEEVLNKGVFYRIKSFDIINSQSNVISQYDLSWSTEDFDVTDSTLAVLPGRLPSDSISQIYQGVSSLAKGGLLFNNKFLLYSTQSDIIYESPAVQYDYPYETYQAKYKVTLNDGSVIYSKEWLPITQNGITTFASIKAINAKIIVKKTNGEETSYSYLDIPMQRHPNMPCSYSFIGLHKYFGEYAFEKNGSHSIENIKDIIGFTEDGTSRLVADNKVLVSELDNPFVFPEDKKITFQSKVIGIAVASTALSQGQFGQFPLYVFTEDGIWAMETAADGSFVSQKPLSREVCINPDSITSIDNAVVFVTDKGVMMIQGSQVMNISPYMNGRHYIPNESARNIIARQEGFSEFENVIKDETPFVAFMKKAKIAYDYAGQRLICIADDETFQYIYKLDTQTWHKVAFKDFDLIDPLNSYPDCLVRGHGLGVQKKCVVEINSSKDGKEYLIGRVKEYFPSLSDTSIESFLYDQEEIDVTSLNEGILQDFQTEMSELAVSTIIQEKETTVTKIYSLGTILDLDPEAEDAPKVAKGILITRPFDLGEPDVYKTIKAIKIRGDFDKGNVKYILQGSNDGKTFYTMNTLRGKSWKMFRIFILADLEPTERISWIDIDFEPRYNNRLR